MKKILSLFLAVYTVFSLCACGGENTVSQTSDTEEISTASHDELLIKDKILGGIVGQMAGAVYGADKDFYYRGVLMPESELPEFSALNINNGFLYSQLYEELTLLSVMETNGFESTMEQYGSAFAATEYALEHAGEQARINLLGGISPTDSGSYLYNYHCEDTDWTVKSEFLGYVCPGDPYMAAHKAYEIGHMYCYGDGVYGGVFVSALNSAAFTAKDINSAVDIALMTIPEDSELKSVLNTVLYRYESGKSFEDTWNYVQLTWGNDDRCPDNFQTDANNDVKLNCAYVLLGLLYGKGDMVNTARYTLRCGQNTAGNTSCALGVLGVMNGYEKLPEIYKKTLNSQNTFSYSKYTVGGYADAAYKVYASRNARFPVTDLPTPVPFEQWKEAPTVFLNIVTQDDKVYLDITAYSVPGIATTLIDFGDGFATHEPVSVYRYGKTGDYTVTVTVTDSQGNFSTVSKAVSVTQAASLDMPELEEYCNLAPLSVAVCSEMHPIGNGNKDIYVICDGISAGNEEQAFDTYAGYMNRHIEYVGYLFTYPCTVDKIVFTEGMHLENGGWFSDGDITVQLLVNGVWTDIDFRIFPQYPNGTVSTDFGEDFEAYTFTFNKTPCHGVRVIGTAGGTAGFISVAELEVYGQRIIG